MPWHGEKINRVNATKQGTLSNLQEKAWEINGPRATFERGGFSRFSKDKIRKQLKNDKKKKQDTNAYQNIRY